MGLGRLGRALTTSHSATPGRPQSTTSEKGKGRKRKENYNHN